VLQMVINDVTEHRQRLKSQAGHRAELRRLSSNVVEAREEERRRIARELHDELGQRLSGLKLDLASLAAAPPGANARSKIDAMLATIDDTVASVRRISSDLRPLILDDLGLNAAIESLARDASRRMGIEVTVRLGEEDPPVDDRVAIAVYRMVQEALTNVGRHARATDVRIELKVDGADLVLRVHDNGIGFPDRTGPQEDRFGLLGIRERAYMLGGQLVIDNPAGGGGRVTVRLPISPPPGTDDDEGGWQ
jgi:two-component system, NarL family, sensor histidine kinase UhpB